MAFVFPALAIGGVVYKAIDEHLDRRAERYKKALREVEKAKELEKHLREIGIPPEVVITEEMIAQGRSVADFLPNYTHVAFCGNRGVGKSSMINALLGLRSGDAEAAPVGTVETTRTRSKFVSAKHPGHIWYDLPGAGTAECTAWQYYYKQLLYIYDIVILVHDSTLQESDINILRLCKWRNQPCVLVRTKSDQHIRNCAEDFDLSAEDARAHYLKEARRDGDRVTKIGGAEVVVEDHLVSNGTIRKILKGNQDSLDSTYSLIDEAKFLKRLLSFSRFATGARR